MSTQPFVRNRRRDANAEKSLARWRAILLLLTSAFGAGAQNQIFVTNTNDSGPGSLRQAIADAAPSGDTVITFPGVTGTILLTGGELTIERRVTILGPGAGVLSLNAGFGGRVVNVASNTTDVVISGISIINGIGFTQGIRTGIGGGGGIRVLTNASVILRDCILASNAAPAFGGTGPFQKLWSAGGAIYNAGLLRLVRCSIFGNVSGGQPGLGLGEPGGDGGGIHNSGQLILESCDLNHNRTGSGGVGGGTCGSPTGNGGWGGGLYNVGRAAISGCTFRNNSTGAGGGGCAGDSLDNRGGNGGVSGNGGAIFSSGVLMVSNCTFVANQTGSGGSGGRGGGGIVSNGGPGGAGGNSGEGGAICSVGSMELFNSVIVGNSTGTGGQGGSGGSVLIFPGNPGPAGATGVSGRGGGIYSSSEDAVIRRCMVVANTKTGTGPDVFGRFTSQGSNVIQLPDDSSGFGQNDFLGIDPDGDGLPNLVEYAFGTDPRTATVGALPVGSVHRIDGTNYFTLAFQRSKSAVGVQCSVLVGNSMATNGWALGSRYLDDSAVHEQTTEIARQQNGTVEIILLRDRQAALSATNRFMRVEVSIP